MIFTAAMIAAAMWGSGHNLPHSSYSVGSAGTVEVQQPWLEQTPSSGVMTPSGTLIVPPPPKPSKGHYFGKG